MKKLMIAAAIVCVAAYAQASAYTWGLSSASDESSSGGWLTDGDFTVIQLLGTVGETDNGDGTYALDFSGVTGVLGNTSTANGDYTIGATGYDAASPVTSDAVTQGTPQAYSILVLEEANVSDYANYEGSYALITGTSIGRADPTAGDPFMDFAFSDPVTADMYKTAASVPEPTSGLLMLIGAAGLALKRKRAEVGKVTRRKESRLLHRRRLFFRY